MAPLRMIMTGTGPNPPASVCDASERLSGLLVRTPLIAEPMLPGFDCPFGTAHVRIKAENLQEGGGVWFRGSAHWLLRQLGHAQRGVLVTADRPKAVRPMLCAAVAARVHRVPVHCLWLDEAVEARQRAYLDALVRSESVSGVVGESCSDVPQFQARFRALADSRAGGRGALGVAPVGIGDEAVFSGLATVGLEIARDASSEVERVLVAAPELVEPVRAGLAAGDRGDVEVALSPGESEAGRSALGDGAGLSTDGTVAGALAQAVADRSPTVVIVHS